MGAAEMLGAGLGRLIVSVRAFFISGLLVRSIDLSQGLFLNTTQHNTGKRIHQYLSGIRTRDASVRVNEAAHSLQRGITEFAIF